MVTCTGHIGIHEWAEVRCEKIWFYSHDVITVRTSVRPYFRPFMYANVTSTRNHITGATLHTAGATEI